VGPQPAAKSRRRRLARRLLAPRHEGPRHPKALRWRGRSPLGSMRTARRTTTSRRARPRWRHSRRAGGGT